MLALEPLLTKDDSLYPIRAKAWDHFLELGLPDKSNEVYRYIKLRKLAEKGFFTGKRSGGTICIKEKSDDIVICPLSEAIKTYGAFLLNRFAKTIKEETDPFVTINTALHQDGVFIYVPPKVVLEKPLKIVIQSDGADFLLPRIQVFVSKLAQVELQIEHEMPSECCVNQVIDVHLEEEARCSVVELLSGHSENSWVFDAVRAHLKRGAFFKELSVTDGAENIRQDHAVFLMQENAEADLNGVWRLGGKRENHVNVLVEHQAPNCRSRQLYKGVLEEVSRSSFEGKILVRKEAQVTDAFQLNNNLVLGERARADSKPNLEIFADDVKASHGATVGGLNEDELFYLRTRGLSQDAARKLLIGSFFQEVLEELDVGKVLDGTD